MHTDTYSNELLALHRWHCAVELHGRLLADWLRDNPGCSSQDFADADFAASVVADDRVQRMEAA